MSSGKASYSSISDATSTVLSIGTIIGIVIGCLAGLAALISIIVIIIICCKKKPVTVHHQQQQQPQMQQQMFQVGPYAQGSWQASPYYPPPVIR